MATKFNLMEALKEKGFEQVENPYSRYGSKAQWYERVWTKEVQTAWHGSKTQRFEFRVVAKYLPGFNGNPNLNDIIFEYSNGKVKSHACNKRAWNALKATVENNGYEF